MKASRRFDDAVILLAEDRPDDVALVKQSFSNADIRNPLYVVPDAGETIAYLQGHGPFGDRARFPFPDLILLDLQMPQRSGFAVLEWLRSHPAPQPARAVVLTSSCEVHDIKEAYRLGASSFLVKPADFEDYTALSRTMAKFWLERPDSSNDLSSAAARDAAAGRCGSWLSSSRDGAA